MNIYQKAIETHINFIQKRQFELRTNYDILNSNIKSVEMAGKLRVEVMSTVKNCEHWNYEELHTNLLINGDSLSMLSEYVENSSIWHVVSPSDMNYYKEFEELLNG